MDREWLIAAVAKAEEHVRRGAQAVARAKEAVAAVEYAGGGVEEAYAFLDTLERSQAIFVADLERLRKELERR